MPSTTEIRTRIEALMDLAPGGLTKIDRYEDPNEPIPSDSIPAYFVGRAGRAEHQNSAAQELFTTRRWLIWVVAAEIEDDNPTARETADETAEALLDDLIYYFRQRPNLELDTDAGLSGIQGISIKDDGLKGYQRTPKNYVAIPIMLDVASLRSR